MKETDGESEEKERKSNYIWLQEAKWSHHMCRSCSGALVRQNSDSHPSALSAHHKFVTSKHN